MPLGPTHRRISRIVQIASGPAIFWMQYDHWLAMQVGLTIGTYVTCDLDTHNPFGKVGEFIGFDTYRRSVTHRAGLRIKDWKNLTRKDEKRLMPWQVVFFSHLPWVGTSVRTILCLAPVLMLLLMFDLAVYISPTWILLIWACMGVQDFAHSGADLITGHLFQEISPGWHFNKEKKRLREEKAAIARMKRLRSLGEE